MKQVLISTTSFATQHKLVSKSIIHFTAPFRSRDPYIQTSGHGAALSPPKMHESYIIRK